MYLNILGEVTELATNNYVNEEFKDRFSADLQLLDSIKNVEFTLTMTGMQ